MPTQWSLRQVRCFVALAETLHFGRAAEKIHITQPALSRQIKTLENGLGFAIVQRNNQGVELTAAGEVFLKGCKKAISALENAFVDADLLDQGFAGRLRIGYTEFAIIADLPHILSRFNSEFPKVIQDSVEGDTTSLLRQLQGKLIDIAFVTGPVVTTGLKTQLVENHRLIAVLYESHPLANKRSIKLADLLEEELVLGEPSAWHYFLQHIDDVFTSKNAKPNIVHRAFSGEGVLGMVSAKRGITLYPDCIQNFYRKGLVLREIDDLDTLIPTYAVWHAEANYYLLENFLQTVNTDIR